MASASIPASPSLEIHACQRSHRSFSFFVQRTCSQLAGFFGSNFWERITLQAAYHEPAVRHAIVAIGSRHELAMQQTGEIATVGIFALEQYNLSIRHLLDPSLSRGQRGIDIYLILSILFACFENIQGNHALSIAHIQSGVKLLRETVYDRDTGVLRHQQFGSPSRINSYASLETYAKIFALLDSQASRIIGDYQRPFFAASSSYAAQIYGDAPISFSSINEAKSTFENGACLFSGSLDAKLSDDSIQLPNRPMKDPRGHLAKLMSKFWLAVQELVQSKREKFSPREELAVAVLQLNVLVTWVSFEVELRPSNASSAWDSFTLQVEEMVLLGEKIASFISDNDSGENITSFSLESGYIIPMYAVASSCRDLTIRRRAIAVLRSVSRQEGLWNSLLAAQVAERIIEIEESESNEMNNFSDSAAALDLFRSRPLLRIDANGGRLHYTLNARGEHPVQEVVEEVFSW
ncbi:hypothetical protein O1611_g3846 [Lasiodiplodia mahajangana]|uniref:Uncharacterized protein n=1 Tax=Lasiodiplodia mahajangana TaxID=1108764 RepID=A0ACC2JQM4_9PEZI|nr:hypothetical protein O1611_g3846 [Lasiodiplodia mahajangana]